jgi:hypothetical protein
LGEGGMGAVYRCVQEPLGRVVALKVITAALTVDRGAIERFQREAKASSSFLHPNIVTIYDYGKDEASGLLYLAMELIPGTPGDEFVAMGPLPWRRAVRILRGVCAALAEAHASGVVHRDLKPANILVTSTTTQQDIAKVVDFGIAKMKDSGSALTLTGAVVGTPGYVAPELFDGQEPSSHTDLYALGVVAFEFLCGRAPFPGKTPMELIKAHILTTPPAPSSWVRDIPADLDALVISLLEKDPARRPVSAQAVDAALALVAGEATPLAAPQPRPDPATDRAGPRPVVPQTATTASLSTSLRWVVTAVVSLAMVGIGVVVALGSGFLRIPVDTPRDAGAIAAIAEPGEVVDGGVAGDGVTRVGPNDSDVYDSLTLPGDAGTPGGAGGAGGGDEVRRKRANTIKVLRPEAAEPPATAEPVGGGDVQGTMKLADLPLGQADAGSGAQVTRPKTDGIREPVRGPSDPDDFEEDDAPLSSPTAKTREGLAGHEVSTRVAAAAGALKAGELSPVLNPARGALLPCFFPDGGLPEQRQGSELRVELSIDGEGRVTATRTRSGKFDSRTATCVTRTLRRLAFPARKQATVAMVGVSLVKQTPGR